MINLFKKIQDLISSLNDIKPEKKEKLIQIYKILATELNTEKLDFNEYQIQTLINDDIITLFNNLIQSNNTDSAQKFLTEINNSSFNYFNWHTIMQNNLIPFLNNLIQSDNTTANLIIKTLTILNNRKITLSQIYTPNWSQLYILSNDDFISFLNNLTKTNNTDLVKYLLTIITNEKFESTIQESLLTDTDFIQLFNTLIEPKNINLVKILLTEITQKNFSNSSSSQENNLTLMQEILKIGYKQYQALVNKHTIQFVTYSIEKQNIDLIKRLLTTIISPNFNTKLEHFFEESMLLIKKELSLINCEKYHNIFNYFKNNLKSPQKIDKFFADFFDKKLQNDPISIALYQDLLSNYIINNELLESSIFNNNIPNTIKKIKELKSDIATAYDPEHDSFLDLKILKKDHYINNIQIYDDNKLYCPSNNLEKLIPDIENIKNKAKIPSLIELSFVSYLRESSNIEYILKN